MAGGRVLLRGEDRAAGGTVARNIEEKRAVEDRVAVVQRRAEDRAAVDAIVQNTGALDTEERAEDKVLLRTWATPYINADNLVCVKDLIL